jgi:hypothetical protein
MFKDQLNMLIAEYKNDVDSYSSDASGLTDMLEAYRKMSLEVALRKAGLCLDQRDKLHRHQWRIPTSSLKRMSELLPKSISEFKCCVNFEAILNTVIDVKKRENVVNIGLLTQYDIALRIGSNLNKLPDEVYLHAGALKGALVINKKIKARKGLSRDLFGMYAKCFDTLLPHETEDFLCVYNKKLIVVFDRL